MTTFDAADTFDLDLPLGIEEVEDRPGPSTEPAALVVGRRQTSARPARQWVAQVVSQDPVYVQRFFSLYEAGAFGARPLDWTSPEGESLRVFFEYDAGPEFFESAPRGLSGLVRLEAVD